MNIQVSLGSWRWLLLSGLGCGGLQACGGTAEGMEPSTGGLPGATGGATNGVGGTTSSSGGTTSTGGQAGGTGGFTQSRRCENPTDLGGNWERCDDGSLHRTEPGTCPNLLPTEPPEPQGEFDQCKSDADCTDAPFGYCVANSGGEQVSANLCQYGCETDSDCADGRICLCGDPIGYCVDAACTSDADCDGELRCSDYVVSPGCGGMAFACETPEDECVTDADCSEGECSYDGSKHVCQPISCVIGRPFLVAGHERLADAIARSDWGVADLPTSLGQEELTEEERAAVAKAWTRVGLMEHASVAAFARFALQLLQLGAPPDLLDAAHQAMADETRHARLCFGLAQKFDGAPHGPGALPTSDALTDSELRNIVLTAVLEGCIGETVAAVEAAEAAEHCASPELSELLRSIAEDERRHAELAWQFVAWVLASADDALQDDVRRLFEHEANNASTTSQRQLTDSERVLAAHGHLPHSFRRTLRARVLEEVVLPSARLLLSRPRSDAATALYATS